MRSKFIVLIVILVLATACSTPFEKHMRDGKDAFKSENYSEAKNHFRLALIESPSDEDAKLLFDAAIASYEAYQDDLFIEKYLKDTEDIFSDYKQILLAEEVARDNDGNINIEDANAIVIEIIDIITKMESLSPSYHESINIKDIHLYIIEVFKYHTENISTGYSFFDDPYIKFQHYLKELEKLSNLKQK